MFISVRKGLLVALGLILGWTLPRASAIPPTVATPQVTGSRAQRVPTESQESMPGLSEKQKRDLMKANFEKMKRDADELTSLAKSLQEELDKSNVNVLSLEVIEKAEKIEKLAKKIKSAARGL